MKVHYQHYLYKFMSVHLSPLTYCGRSVTQVRSTNVFEHVTCKQCIKYITHALNHSVER